MCFIRQGIFDFEQETSLFSYCYFLELYLPWDDQVIFASFFFVLSRYKCSKQIPEQALSYSCTFRLTGQKINSPKFHLPIPWEVYMLYALPIFWSPQIRTIYKK